MVKHAKNCNQLEGNKAPMADEIDAAIIVGDKQFKGDHSDHVNLIEKQILE